MDCPSAMKMIDTLNEEHDKTFSENVELKEEIKRLKKVSDIKTDLNRNLLCDVIQLNRVIEEIKDDTPFSPERGTVAVYKQYGHQFIDEWNKIYNKLVQDLLETLNKYEDYHEYGIHARVIQGFNPGAPQYIVFDDYSEDEEYSIDAQLEESDEED